MVINPNKPIYEEIIDLIEWISANDNDGDPYYCEGMAELIEFLEGINA